MIRHRIFSVSSSFVTLAAVAIVGCGAFGSDDTASSTNAVSATGDFSEEGGKPLLACRSNDPGPRPCKGLGPIAVPDVVLAPMYLAKEEVDVDVHVDGTFTDDWNTVSLVVGDKSARLGMNPHKADHHFTLTPGDRVKTYLKTDIDDRTYTFSGATQAVVTKVTVDVTPSAGTFDKWRDDATALADDLQKLIELRDLAKKFETLATKSDSELAQLEKSTLESAQTLLIGMGSELKVSDLFYADDDAETSKRGSPKTLSQAGWGMSS